jgi:hypothetical protein
MAEYQTNKVDSLDGGKLLPWSLGSIHKVQFQNDFSKLLLY